MPAGNSVRAFALRDLERCQGKEEGEKKTRTRTNGNFSTPLNKLDTLAKGSEKKNMERGTGPGEKKLHHMFSDEQGYTGGGNAFVFFTSCSYVQ